MPVVNWFPIQVQVNWSVIVTFNSFSVHRDIGNFVDTFDMTFSNFNGASSNAIPIWWFIELFNKWVLFFRGLIENSKVVYIGAGSTMTVSGREELLVLAETDADPKIWPFNGWTDNAIITKMLSGYPRKLSLSNSGNFSASQAKKIKNYTITWRSVRIGQIVEDICKMNDFLIYKKWDTVYKKSYPSNSDGLRKWPDYFLYENEWVLFYSAERILSMTITEDISAVRSRINAYSYTTGKRKTQAQIKLINPQLLAGTYPQRIRNNSGLKGYKIDRLANCMAPGKDISELKGASYSLLRTSDIQASIEIVVYGIQDTEILDTIRVDLNQEKISNDFYVKSVVYNMQNTNMLTTTITAVPFIDYTQ